MTAVLYKMLHTSRLVVARLFNMFYRIYGKLFAH